MEIASPFDSFIHILIDDEKKDPGKQRKLHGRHLTVREHAAIDDICSAVSHNGRLLNTGTANLMALHLGITKMEGFFDRNGTPVNLERNEKLPLELANWEKPWKEIAFDFIPMLDMLKFAKKVRDGGDIVEAEVKN